MAGKRVAAPDQGTAQKKSHKAVWIVIAVIAMLALGGAAGLCAYAAGFDGVFPGVTMAGIPLEGLSLSQTEDRLDQSLMERVDESRVTVTADGEDLGTYALSQLGAYAVAGETAREAYGVGRESGALGWLKNGWTMARCLLGRETALEPTVYYDEGRLDDLIDDMAETFDRDPVDGSYELTREGLFATKHQDGRALDREKLAEALLSGGETVEAPWEVVPAQALDTEVLAAQLSAEPSPARYDIEQGKVVDGQVGVSVDADAARYVLEAAAEGETVELPAQVTYPEMTAQELEAVLFRDLLGTCTTNVSGSAARRGNVKLAGSEVNGTILNDGDIFDYNQVVGERTEERGFGAAATYINGETVDTIGGGICQVSSTIYKATLLSNLEIVERYAHRYYPGYITMGMDATVSWGGPEFRFKNNTGYPIRIDVTYKNNQLTVNIYGTKTDDTYVKMTYEQLSSTPYETEYVETDELPYGTQKQKQNGYTGYEVKTYRNVYSGDGKLISSTLEAKSVYKSRNEIILVGTAGKPAETTPSGGGDTSGTGGGGNTAGDEPSLPEEDTPADEEIPGWLNP